MKKIGLVIVLFTQLSFAQVKKNVGEFDKVKVFDRISVELIPSNEERIEIKGSRSSEVEVVNKNGELKIRMALKKLLDGEDISAVLYFKRIESIDANEGSFVGCGQTFKQSDIEITAQEGAEVKVALEVQKVKVKTYTGGIVTLSGSAANQEISSLTGGIVSAKDLKTEQTTVTINAGGDAKVNASELVDAKIRAGGTITIYGKPAKINKKTTLGGTIEEVRE
ncbi:MAG TPA: head GIN domain-containing protein [Flavobacterium sp.]|nr:head GIN domain-containing protein [Flavobacterium sp.]